MININMVNFGPHTDVCEVLESKSLPNGAGKTTLVNAYVWALTGRTLNGFEPRRLDAGPHAVTSVTIKTQSHTITRYARPKGTSVFIGNNPCEQKDVELLLDGGTAFAVACANVNMLADPGLTVDDLRKLLITADLMDGDAVKELRKKYATLIKELKTASEYAMLTVTVPVRTAEPITEAESEYMSSYAQYSKLATTYVKRECVTCGATLDENTYRKACADVFHAQLCVDDMRKEVERISAKLQAYDADTHAITIAENTIAAAKRARDRAAAIKTELVTIGEQLKSLDEEAVRAELPEGVQIITEKLLKNGNVQDTCQLTYKGVPLKSVNKAKRIEICVRILANAREKKGSNLPIIVDNAECVQGLQDVPNLIRLSVG